MDNYSTGYINTYPHVNCTCLACRPQVIQVMPYYTWTIPDPKITELEKRIEELEKRLSKRDK